MPDNQNYDRGAAYIAAAAHCLVLTGAGISAESGIPTFREAQTGLWARFAPQDLATPEAFADDAQRVWAWYRWRRTLIARGGVNAGHQAIARLDRGRTLSIATQNVDGLHSAAGNADVAELHGNIWRERCPHCAVERVVAVAESNENAPLPTCIACRAVTRPAVVWFGEALPRGALVQAQNALARADCVLVIGTSNQVYPAAALVEQALASSAPVVEINPQRTAVSSAVDLHLAARASIALPELARRVDARLTER